MVGSGQDAEDPGLNDIRRALLRSPSEDDDICLMRMAKIRDRRVTNVTDSLETADIIA